MGQLWRNHAVRRSRSRGGRGGAGTAPASAQSVGTLELIVRLLSAVLLILANAFFVVSEFALTRTRQFDKSAFDDDDRLRLGWKMTEKLEIYLTACQLGISTTSVILGVVAEPAVTTLIRPGAELVGLSGQSLQVTSVVIAVILLNLIHKIWGEQAPTYLGVESPVAVARHTSRPLYWWTKATYPLVIAGDSLAKATLKLFGVEITRSWAEAEAGGGEESDEKRRTARDPRSALVEALARAHLPADRREEVMAAYEIDAVPVRDIMVPREEVEVLRAGAPWRENLARLAATGKTRLPLVGESLDDAIGAIYSPKLFRYLPELESGETELTELVADLIRVDVQMPVADLIDRFQDVHQEIAIVEENGRAAGVVTITDALERIAGQVEDPLDDEEAGRKRDALAG